VSGGGAGEAALQRRPQGDTLERLQSGLGECVGEVCVLAAEVTRVGQEWGELPSAPASVGSSSASTETQKESVSSASGKVLASAASREASARAESFRCEESRIESERESHLEANAASGDPSCSSVATGPRAAAKRDGAYR